ncbi:MAG TPA: DUF167 domain-containing protein [Burkholderiaceae bacterium]|nr:DUF167 domain-containing protein [Burkholderiaceae bacterium]
MARTLQIRVKPQSRVDALVEQPDGTWLAQVRAMPVEGQANAAVIALVASHFGVRRTQVRIKSGGASRTKRVEIDD